MSEQSPPTSSDEERFVRIGLSLVDAVADALGPWLVVMLAGSPGEPDNGHEAIERAVQAVRVGLHDLVVTDVDAQRTTPLTIVRGALLPFGDPLPPPAALGELSEEAGEAGIMWGAAKAHLHLSRRRAGR